MDAQPTQEEIDAFAAKFGIGAPAQPMSMPPGEPPYGPPPPEPPFALSPETIAHFGSQLENVGRPRSAIVPPQPTGTGPMVPVRNYSGQIIGERPQNSPPLFQNPFAGGGAANAAPGAPPQEPSSQAPTGPALPSNGFTGDPNVEPAAPSATLAPRFQAPAYGDIHKKELQLEKDRLSLIDAATQAEMGRNAVNAANQYTAAQRAEESALQAQSRANDRDTQWQAVLKKREQLQDAVASGRVDPDRLYGHADTGTRLGLILGGALGGAFQGWNKLQSNPFIDSVNMAIQRDIDAQKEQLQSKRNALSENTNMLGQLRGYFGDARLADLAFHEMVLQTEKQKLEAATTHSQNPTTLANGELAKNAFDIQIEAKKAEFARQAQMAALTAGNPPADKTLVERFVATGPNGQGYIAKDKEAATAGSALVQLKGQFQNFARDAIALRQQTSAIGRLAGGWSTVAQSPEYAALASKQAQMLGALKLAEQTKSITPELSKLAEESMGNFLSPGGHPDVRSRSFLEGLDEKIDAHRRAQGGQEAVNAPRIDAHGAIGYQPIGLLGASSPRGGMPKPIPGT